MDCPNCSLGKMRPLGEARADDDDHSLVNGYGCSECGYVEWR